MTSEGSSLARLCALAGVVATYRDAWGSERRVPAEALAGVLRALGIAADTPADIAASIAALEAEAWRPLLPPAIVVRNDVAASVVLSLPERLNAGRVVWSVACEDGTARDGAAEIDTLALLQSKQAGHERHDRRSLPLPALPLGYHRLSVAAGHEEAEMTLIVAPAHCYAPAALAGEAKAWGVTAQLYSLRSARNWGMGDYSDLGALAELAATRGAVALGVNPLHALFPADPGRVSPYSPSSRQFLNPLYLDVTAFPDFAACAEAQERVASAGFAAALAAARDAPLVEHGAVAALKQPIFAALYRDFADHHLNADGTAATVRGAAFRQFQQDGGVALADYATFTALQAHRLAQGGDFSWRTWPAPLQDARSLEVARFAAAHRAEIELHAYLEWEGNRQFAASARRAREAGLMLGIYGDLAVGVDPDGAATWSDPALNAAGAAVGAPPDLLNLKGQNWGLAPVNPVALRRQSYGPFVAALRTNMRHVGILRIDHAMALKQLYWVPRGAGAAAGAYVQYPFEDLLGILALESVRNRCAVVGEDLGTVPAGFSARLNAAGVLSYRVLLFERDERGGFLPPERYPRSAAATFSTHDLVTLHGFWLGRDLVWRRALDLYPDEAAAAADMANRRADRRRLLDALIAAGFLTGETARRLLPDDDTPVFAPELAEAVHGYLGGARSVLALLQIEDALGETEQANLPGTVEGHPNWRRKLSRPLEAFASDEPFRRVTAALARSRGSRGDT